MLPAGRCPRPSGLTNQWSDTWHQQICSIYALVFAHNANLEIFIFFKCLSMEKIFYWNLLHSSVSTLGVPQGKRYTRNKCFVIIKALRRFI